MSDLKSALDEAAGEGIISPEQAGRLLPYLAGRGIKIAGARDPLRLSEPRDADAANALEDTEAPRFIRGFHDVLITIGVIVLLIGLAGLASNYAPLPAIIILAEILVRRQRLALPAVVLTIALSFWLLWICVMSISHFSPLNPDSPLATALVIIPNPIVLGLFYWRYRVPIALALLYFWLFAFALTAVFYLIERLTGSTDGIRDYPVLSLVIFLVAALGSFATAMRFDLGDPRRVTRRSDVAFWLHLATAPALLYATILLVFRLELGGTRSFADIGDVVLGGYTQSLTVLVIVVVMMLVGLVIDRRAFVTAGLVSLGLAVGAILRQNHASFDRIGFLVLMVVGLIVLVIGIGWLDLRRFIVRLLPEAWQARLPALR